MENLVTGVALLALGPIIWKFCEKGQIVPWLNRITALCVAFVVLFHLLPETFEAIGWWSIGAAVAGFAMFLVIEYAWFLPKAKVKNVTVVLVLIGLAFHMVLDGIGLSGGHEGHGHDHGHFNEHMSLAVLLHRLPSGLFLWVVLKDRFGTKWTTVLYSFFGILTIAGYFGAEELMHELSPFMVQMVQALIAGALLHMVGDMLLPGMACSHHGHESEENSVKA
jgi:zinc transporter ZupT